MPARRRGMKAGTNRGVLGCRSSLECEGGAMAIDEAVLDSLPAERLEVIGPKVRDGDILLCSAHDPFSRLIGWSTESPWSHVAIACRWGEEDRIMAFECVDRIGVHAVALDRFISQTSDGTTPYPGKIILARHDDITARRDKTEDDGLKPMVDFAIDHMGDRFSGVEIAKIGARIALGRLDHHMPKVFAAKDGFICSEYVAACLATLGIEIPWDGLGFIAPADIANDPKVRAIGRFETR